MTDIMLSKEITSLEVFTAPKGLDPFIDEIREMVDSFEHDLTTAAGRKLTASFAAKIAKSKTYLDGKGKDLVSEWKEKSKVVDGERKRMRDELDSLKEEARGPLTEWENIEKEKLAKIEAAKVLLSNLVQPHGLNSDQLKSNLEEMMAISCEDEAFCEQRNIAISSLESSIEEMISSEEKEIELANLRREKDIREAKEREEMLTKEADARAEREREARIAAEEDRLRQAEQAEKDRIAKAESDKIAKEERAKRVAAEKELEEKRKAKDEEEARAKDHAHRKLVNCECLASLMKHGINEDQAKSILISISKNEIPHLSIRY